MRELELTPAGGKRFPRLTRGALAVVAATLAVELLGRLLGSNWVTMAAAALIGGLFGAAALTPNPRAAVVSRTAPPRLRVGEPATVRITVTNPRRLRRLGPLIVVDRAPGLPDGVVLVPSVEPGGTAVADLVRTPEQRGRWDMAGTVTVKGHSPLGAFARRGMWTWLDTTIVHPPHAKPLPPAAAASPLSGADRGSGRVGSGTEVLGLRDWRPGDPRASVHWRSSAKRGSLLVLERELPKSDDLIVALGRSGAGEAWELAVSRGAATAAAAHRSGSRVMLVSGGGVTTPTSLTALLDWFADVEANPVATVSQVRQLTPAGDTPIVWLTAEDPS